MAKPKTDGGASLKTLKNDLKTEKLRTLYIFYGEEAYLRDYYLGKLRELLLPPGMEAFNYRVLDGKTCSVRDIVAAVDCFPMMSERTLVLVNDFDLSKVTEGDMAPLREMLEDLPEYTCLVFHFDVVEYKVDGRTKLADVLKTRALTVEFAQQAQNDLVDWIFRRFRHTGHEIDSETAKYLMFYCGGLMQTLVSEIGKISAYARHKRITKKDIEAVATPQIDAMVFNLTDALGAKDYNLALKTLGELLQLQEPVQLIMVVLTRYLRQLYAARVALETHRTADDLVAIAPWKLKPYPARKLMTAAQRVTVPWCRTAMEKAARADFAMRDGGGEDQAILTQLVLELAHG